VIDSGIGIKEGDQTKLFKLFGSIKDEKKKINTQGIGLGLVISKLIVEKFNGTIDFISEYKEGSTFFFSFEIEPYRGNELIQHKASSLYSQIKIKKRTTINLNKHSVDNSTKNKISDFDL